MTSSNGNTPFLIFQFYYKGQTFVFQVPWFIQKLFKTWIYGTMNEMSQVAQWMRFVVQNRWKIQSIVALFFHIQRKRKTTVNAVVSRVLKNFKLIVQFLENALGRNRTHISRTGILRAIRYTTRANCITDEQKLL